MLQPGALQGVKVIDWSVFQVGPYSAAMLADLGADVIHVEEPGRGDALRGIKTLFGVPLMLNGRHLLFEEHNRSKRGITVDLRREEGREVIYRLAKESDVFLTNYRQAAVARMGMDYDTLRQLNPRLVYARASGFGFEGPDKDSPSLDLVAQARSGAMMASGEEGSPPTFLSLGMGDRVTSYLIAFGVVTALLAREKLGVGQRVDVSQLQAMALIQGNGLMPAFTMGNSIPRHNRLKPPRNPLYNSYRCQDGRWIVMAAIQGGRYWGNFCRTMGHPELEHDPRFVDEEARMRHREELVRILDEAFATRPAQDWIEAMRESADMPIAVANRLIDLAEDEQILANDYILNWDHPAMGKIKFPGFAVKFTETPAALQGPAPELGQHTEEVMLGLGYTWEDIGALKDQGII
ncbi:MAG: CoA transferase [Dehalococcoidia bacterium]|jgi:crotonobetainyl-CoA:carnitine CoA-transferase CaiB-like acyl-CoA transferase|nr:CoA transferase [Dehalococcoidia bacterium]